MDLLVKEKVLEALIPSFEQIQGFFDTWNENVESNNPLVVALKSEQVIFDQKIAELDAAEKDTLAKLEEVLDLKVRAIFEHPAPPSVSTPSAASTAPGAGADIPGVAGAAAHGTVGTGVAPTLTAAPTPTPSASASPAASKKRKIDTEEDLRGLVRPSNQGLFIDKVTSFSFQRSTFTIDFDPRVYSLTNDPKSVFYFDSVDPLKHKMKEDMIKKLGECTDDNGDKALLALRDDHVANPYSPLGAKEKFEGFLKCEIIGDLKVVYWRKSIEMGKNSIYNCDENMDKLFDYMRRKGPKDKEVHCAEFLMARDEKK